MRVRHLLALLVLFSLNPASLASETAPHPPHDTVRPALNQYMAEPAILVFSKTRSYRHDKGIAGADRYFAELADDLNMGFFTTSNAAIFNDEQLARFDLVIFNNMSGDALSKEQQEAFETWFAKGNALVALHSAGDASHSSWKWFDREVIGPEFIGHPADPQFQSAKLVSLAEQHPIMRGLPSHWIQTDEWYSFEDMEYLAGSVPLIGLGEASYSPENLVYGDREDLRMGDKSADHPIAWARCMGNARAVYSAAGHSYQPYDTPNYRRFLNNAASWVLNKNRDRIGCAPFR